MAFLFLVKKMSKIYSKAYSKTGREEHERIFGKRKPPYDDKLMRPDAPKPGGYEVKRDTE